MISHPRSPRPTAVALATVVLQTAAAFAQPPKGGGGQKGGGGAPQMYDPPAPFIPTDMFDLPDDLEVTLWARTPLFRNPSNIDIDAQGRVWLAEAYNYRRHMGR